MNQRIIKFRAWIAERNQMTEGVQPNFSKLPALVCMVPDNIMKIFEPGGEKNFWYNVPVDAIMQYVDFKDKNGKEVYESDVIKVEGNGVVQYRGVFWDSSFACFLTKNIEHKEESVDMILGFSWLSSHSSIEVVGNIYENPELIK